MPIEVRVQVRTQSSREYSFDRPRVVLGCHPFNELVLADSGLSARHGLLHVTEQGLRYDDLGGRGAKLILADETVRMRGGSHALSPGDTLVLGAAGEVQVTILGFAPTLHGEPELVPLPTSPASTLLSTFSPELQQKLVDGVATILRAGSIADARLTLQALVNAVVADCATAFVVPQGDHGFHDRVIICDGVACRPEMLTPDSDALLARLTNGGALDVVPRDGGFDLNIPYVDRKLTVHPSDPGVVLGASGQLPEMRPRLLGYLRVSVATRPPDGQIRQLATLGVCLEPALLALLRLENSRREARSLAAESRYFRDRARRHYFFKDLVGQSPAMQLLYQQLDAALRQEGPVLIVGEAGSGKKMVGRALHHRSQRKQGMFISQHCSELSEPELDIEIFGSLDPHTGAARRGLFELGDGGTIFLDEIDRLPLPLQAKLVRVLREREVRRTGDQTGRPIDVRVLAATHADLAQLVRGGTFRRDLLAAFGTTALLVPPLRERQEDLIALGEHFLHTYSRRYGLHVLGISDEARARLLAHGWRGNVRELQVVFETAVMKARDGLIETQHLDLASDAQVR